MKKYKLIKEYPGSPKLGDIARDEKICYVYGIENRCLGLTDYDFERNTEFWEEVKEEPNYLITAFKYLPLHQLCKHDTQLKDSYCFGDGKAPFYSSEQLLSDKKFELFSIKNEFGKEFCIGDKVRGDNEEFTIESFQLGCHILGGCYACGTNKLGKCKVSIKLINIVKTPLYTTTDGAEIMEGDRLTLYIALKDFHIPTSIKASKVDIYNGFSKSDAEVADRYLTFISEENRDKYIKENQRKPVLVAADGKEIFEGDTIYHFYKPFEYMMHKSIARHNTIYGDIIFYTEEKAKEYIDNNKPKYSLADIENCYPHANITGNRIKDIPVVATLFSNLKKLGK